MCPTQARDNFCPVHLVAGQVQTAVDRSEITQSLFLSVCYRNQRIDILQTWFNGNNRRVVHRLRITVRSIFSGFRRKIIRNNGSSVHLPPFFTQKVERLIIQSVNTYPGIMFKGIAEHRDRKETVHIPGGRLIPYIRPETVAGKRSQVITQCIIIARIIFIRTQVPFIEWVILSFSQHLGTVRHTEFRQPPSPAVRHGSLCSDSIPFQKPARHEKGSNTRRLLTDYIV